MENREWRMRLMSDWQTVVGVIRLFRETENGEGRMRLMSDWQTVVGVIRLYRETENGEGRMRLMSDWQTVVGVIRLYRETENGEWRMENEADERLANCGGRYSVISRNGEWRMENEAVAQQFSILHSPFPLLLSSLAINYFCQCNSNPQTLASIERQMSFRLRATIREGRRISCWVCRRHQGCRFVT